MAVGVKLLHIVSDNSLIKVVHRFQFFGAVFVSETLLRTYLTSLQLVTETVWRQ